MKTFGTLSLCLLFSCTAVRAQHNVKVSAGDSDASPVASALKARIGGTMRYHLIDNAIATELSVAIQCIGAPQTSFACEVTVFYYPVDLMKVTPLWVSVTLHTGPNAEGIAESMFEAFVKNTSEEHLAKLEDDHIEYIRLACNLHGANGDDKPDRVKTACMVAILWVRNEGLTQQRGRPQGSHKRARDGVEGQRGADHWSKSLKVL